ncbi:MAG: hypothetical protein C0592_09950 [Marinilabiliales bacterium]|nr:MAG: hypothetical protein C0592_09950 [Marinilabiliales bacterium]
MTCILRLRWFILAGNSLFIAYAILIQAYPILILNSFNAAVNIWFIWQAYHLKGNYAVLHAENNAPMLERFLSYYIDDIHKFFPKFIKFEENDVVFLIVKGTAVISAAGFRKINDNTYEAVMDYVAKTHRNHKPGKLIYEQENIFDRLACKSITAHSYNKKHDKYLRRMKFKSVGNHKFELKPEYQNKS